MTRTTRGGGCCIGRCVTGVLAAVAASATASAGGTPIVFVDADAPPGGDGASWDAALNDLTPALEAAEALGGGAQIWVAEGLYLPGEGSDDRESTFQLIDGVELYGGFAGGETELSQRNFEANQTILSGNLGDPDKSSDNAYSVVTFDDIFGLAVLDGFTVEAGEATGSGSQQDVGGGFRLRFAAAEIRNCLFRNNTAADSGGAIDASTLTDLFVLGCTFADNSAGEGGAIRIADAGEVVASAFDGNSAGFGGAITSSGPNTTLSRVAFRSNFGNFGGALFVSNGAITVQRSGFFGNVGSSGGGAYLAGAGVKRFVNCRFGDCVSNDGGAIWNSAELEMTNCQIVRSLAFLFGGGVYCITENASLTMRNCTVASNEALFTGGGVYVAQGAADVASAIFWKNKDTNGMLQSSQIRTTDQSSAQITYSNLSGWEGDGEGNFEANPLFIDPAGEDGIPGNEDDDYGLTPDSPCIDRGDGLGLPADVTDLDGDGDFAEPLPLDLNMVPRVLDEPGAPNDGSDAAAPVDVGAVEFIPAQIACEGDIDGDGLIGSTDLNLFLDAFVTGGGPDDPADLDGDGDIDTVDLNILLQAFGQSC